MSLADKIFVDMCKDILDNGTTQRENWSARTGRTERVHIPSRNSVW